MQNTAFDVLSQLDKLAGNSCHDVLPEIMKIGGLASYVRSVGFIENGIVYCSSISGDKKIPLSDINKELTEVSFNDYTIRSLENTIGVKTRPAIIYIQKTKNKRNSFVVLDSQYLVDVMDSITENNNYHIAVSIGNGYQINSHDSSNMKVEYDGINQIDNELIRITTNTPLLDIVSYLLLNILICIPISLIFSYFLTKFISRLENRKMSLPKEIEKGILDNEFYVKYQPVFNTNTGVCTGAEALLRWKRPDGRNISPDIFIKAAEDDGKIVELTQHLFELVKKDVMSWTLPKDFHLGVNISPSHMSSNGFVKDILILNKFLARRGIKTIIEITERSTISDNDKTKEILIYLRKKGVVIAIDDFGTGYCSLAYLENFPVDYLKIDKSFIDTIETSNGGTPILDMIISLAKQIDLEIVAEGVETEYQFKYLKYSEVHYLQGYYFSPPLDKIELNSLINPECM